MADTWDFDVAIVGAGAAGLGAARTLQRLGKSFVLLEASHRIGGRGYTEEILPGMPFDLGCHWLHSGSLNPFAKIADELGIAYTKEGFPRGAFMNGEWVKEEGHADWNRFYERQDAAIAKAVATGKDCPVWEVTEREHRWTRIYDHICSLNSSLDVDQVSVIDLMAYNDTEENWPIKDGYGTLLTRFGVDLPVSLNSAVTEIDWSGPDIRLTTAKGTIRVRHALVTVSTGILAAGDIRFTPDLPDWKHEAIAGLPLGNHNRICLAYDRDVFGPDASDGFTAQIGDDEPMSFRIRPFGFDYVVGLTGGRFADWLERAGQQASIDHVEKQLQAVFGSDITQHVTARIVTAWRGDPWVKGAYSAAQPGRAHQREKLAASLDDKLHFAGEATSSEFFSTAHGAYLSGIDVAEGLR